MIVIKIWQLVAAIVVLFIGVYFIVEYRINKNNLIVSEFIIIKDKKMKEYVSGMFGVTADVIDKIQARLVEEITSNHEELRSKIVELLGDKDGRNN